MKATIIPKTPELLKRNFDLMWRQRGLFLFRLVLLWYGVAMSSTGVAGADVMRPNAKSATAMSTTWGIGTPRRCQPYTMPSPIAPGGRQAPRDARARLGRTSGAFQVYGTRRRPDDAAHFEFDTSDDLEPAPGAAHSVAVIVIRHLSLPGHARARAPSRVPFGHFRVARRGKGREVM